jgi:hypothetical protein
MLKQVLREKLGGVTWIPEVVLQTAMESVVW